MEKIVLYYKFVPVSDPEVVRLWQKTLASSLKLKGRIIISEHGINGTLGGSIKDLKEYVKQTKNLPIFKDIAFKWSDGNRDNFPKLSVKVRPEIVTFGVPDRIKVNEKGIVGGGKHLKPKQVHQLIEEKGDDVIFFDGRNAYEAAIGRFKNAVVPATRHTRDFPTELKSKKYDALKKKPVITYCTGGIRCEVLSMLMVQEGFEEVYQIDGGIVNYGETYSDEGFWEGSLYVFDERMATQFSDKAEDIGECFHCSKKTSNYENCSLKSCNDLILMCSKCAKQLNSLCQKHLAQQPA
ncbi:MAG TPA: rhodanese-related sulfurtransferase [Candidatus Saccharimonadales bacterium]|nr:rhodanese-related sulfurtransferase [Candidatus Saccharimonadales bacterium]